MPPKKYQTTYTDEEGNVRLLPLTSVGRNLAESCWALACLYAIRAGVRPHEVLDSDQFANACLGLCMAAQRYDRKRGVKFTSFSGWWMRSNINHAIDLSNQPKRGGTGRGKRHRQIKTHRLSELKKGMEGDYDPFDIDELADRRERRPEVAASLKESAERAADLLRYLDPRSRRMVERWFGGMSLRAIGDDERPRVTRERVRQVIERSIRKMQKAAGVEVAGDRRA